MREPLPHDELHALVDGRLDPAACAALLQRLQSDPEARELVAAWSSQRDALRGLHPDAADEPIPPTLLDTARRIDTDGSRLDRWQHRGGLAASVLLAFVCGWFGHSQWQAIGAAKGMQARAANDFGRQALVAHAVYSPEVRHPVEVPAAQHDHLVQWLSKRLGRPLKVPELGAHGYELVGGRLLPGEQGARAQFMYQNAGGGRITLYVGAVEASAGSAAARGETAFKFTTDGGVAGFYWVDQGFGYALSGPLSRSGLLALAESVYRQL